MKTESEEKDWVKVLYEVILKILTLGFYHVEKHRRAWANTRTITGTALIECYVLLYAFPKNYKLFGDPN